MVCFSPANQKPPSSLPSFLSKISDESKHPNAKILYRYFHKRIGTMMHLSVMDKNLAEIKVGHRLAGIGFDGKTLLLYFFQSCKDDSSPTPHDIVSSDPNVRNQLAWENRERVKKERIPRVWQVTMGKSTMPWRDIFGKGVLALTQPLQPDSPAHLWPEMPDAKKWRDRVEKARADVENWGRKLKEVWGDDENKRGRAKKKDAKKAKKASTDAGATSNSSKKRKREEMDEGDTLRRWLETSNDSFGTPNSSKKRRVVKSDSDDGNDAHAPTRTTPHLTAPAGTERLPEEYSQGISATAEECSEALMSHMYKLAMHEIQKRTTPLLTECTRLERTRAEKKARFQELKGKVRRMKEQLKMRKEQ